MAAAPVLPEFLARFEAAHAEVEVSLLKDDHDRLLEGLREGRLDLCLTYGLQVPAGVAFEPLATIEPNAILPLDHPLAAKGSVTPEELAGHPMVLIDLPGSSASLLSAFKARGPSPRVSVRTRGMALARSLAANGFGLALANVRPLSDLVPDGKPVAFRPLKGGPRALRMGLARLEGVRRTRVVEAFEDHCRASMTPGAAPGLRMD